MRGRTRAAVLVRHAALVVASLALWACDKEAAPKSEANFGEPVGIQIGAHASVPALSVAIAVTKGRDVAPLVGSVAGAVNAAAAECPAFLASLAAGKTTRLIFGVEGGKAHIPAKLPDEEGAACLTHALDGKAMTADKPEALDVITEIRSVAGDAGLR